MQIAELYQEFLGSTGVATDTRQAIEGKVFFALRGPRHNGNEHAAAALEAGAKLAVVDDEQLAERDGFLFVEDSLATLQALAAYHRRQMTGLTVLAICGSNGKTTTKELTAAVLSKRYPVLVTEGNLNNHIGVPLTLLRLTEAHRMAIIEMGANHEGETALLCRIADPDFGLITNVGKDHLEGFGSLEGVGRAHGELIAHLIAGKGLAFINSRDEHIGRIAAGLTRRVSYPQPGDFVHIGGFLDGPWLAITAPGLERPLRTQLTGLYNLDNVAAALCVGKYFDVPAADAAEAVAGYQPRNNRSQIIETARNLVISDCYNANPSSMAAALESLAAWPTDDPRPRHVILGDMAELGPAAEEEHRALAGRLSGLPGLSGICLVGELMGLTAEGLPSAQHFATADELAAHLSTEPLVGGVIMLKGSRSARLERLIDLL